MELAAFAGSEVRDSSFRSARVIRVDGRTLTVDMGGPVEVQSLDSCNPLPDQFVLIAEGKFAIGAVAGEVRQATVKITDHSTNTVVGLVNGVSRIISKVGSYTPTIGDVLPLFWSADASAVWAGATPGLAYVPPPVSGGGAGTGTAGGGGGTSTGGGSTGGGGIVTTGTATYSATGSGWFRLPSAARGSLNLNSGATGYYEYGFNRMNELQSRSIQWGTISLPRTGGSGNVTITANKGGSTYSTVVSTGSAVGLNGSFLARLIDGSGGVNIYVTGSGWLAGRPSGGIIRIGWRSS